MGKRDRFTCTICGTDIEVPLCCGKKMTVKDGELRCTLCNTGEQIPICCGKKNILVTKESS